MQIAIIGGGAAGFFSALSAKYHHPGAEVTIYEKTDKLLSKVRISGGGRCNVMHHCFDINELITYYPRGGRFLRKVFHQFTPEQTRAWFENRGVHLKTEADGRMFSVTDSSETVIECLLSEARKTGVVINTKSSVSKLIPGGEGIEIVFRNGGRKTVEKVIVASGGSPRKNGLDWLSGLGHRIVNPVPSLFTFNMPGNGITELQGVVAEPAAVRIAGTKFKSEGPLLITHWGMSGPAVLKLSAFAARELHKAEYKFNCIINWTGQLNEQEIRAVLEETAAAHPRKQVNNVNPLHLPARLWQFLLRKSGVEDTVIWQNMGKKNINRLVHILSADEYEVNGKTTFKEEFVIAGGVDVRDVDAATMQSRKVPGLYFAGEVLDIDGVTGGFNFQAAWSTGFVAGK